MSWRCAIVVAAVLVCSERTALAKESEDAPEPIQIRLTARFVMPHEWLRGLVRVQPNSGNRLLRVTIDSPNFFRSSEVQLDGASAAKSHLFVWKSLPPGAYEVTAIVFGSDGRRIQRRARFQVIGTSIDDDGSGKTLPSD